jgi:triosephosphate isomerase
MNPAMYKKLVIANWKMNPATSQEALALAKKIDAAAKRAKNVEAVVAPPYPFLHHVACRLSHVALGAQDVFWEEQGAFTGEISPAMLKSLKVEYVIIGHSERRRHLAETDAMVNKKVLAALKSGLRVILCVGESWEVRKKGLEAAKRFVERQLMEDLRTITNYQLPITKLIAVYEPVWAISGGDADHPADDPKDALEMIRFIKSALYVTCRLSHVAVLYGGSVNAKNAELFLKEPEISGALVGGASLKPEEFIKILEAAEKCGTLPQKS